jgi:twitching motility protein PilT
MAAIDALFREVIDQKGSDLHLEQGQRPKIRVHGSLREIAESQVLNEKTITELLSEIVTVSAWQRFASKGDLDFAYELKTEGLSARFRCNFYRHIHGAGAVFRLIPSDIVPLDRLDMSETLASFVNLRSGLVLVTGPTGSGKSTTMAAILDHINRTRCRKIITIEQPVEFVHKNQRSIITHREVEEDTETFASGLRGALKSDVDVVLVGEMRDAETIMLALTAAERGILVFGTLHTNSAAKTIDRIMDVFPMAHKNQVRTILANTLQAVVSQQLLKSADGSRRWVAYEIMLRTKALGPIIMDGDSTKLTTEIQTSRTRGAILMDDCLAMLVRDGRVKAEDAFMKALDKSGFLKKAHVAKHNLESFNENP